MITFARSLATSSRLAAMSAGLRRLWSTDPMLLAITIGIVALIAMFCLFAMAEMATLFGADAFGNFLRDAGQQVGGAGGVGALGAAAAGGAVYGPPIAPTSAERGGLPPDYSTYPQAWPQGGYYPGFRSPGDQGNYGIPPTEERNGKLYVKLYFYGKFQGWREAYRIEGGHGFVDPGTDIPVDLLGLRN